MTRIGVHRQKDATECYWAVRNLIVVVAPTAYCFGAACFAGEGLAACYFAAVCSNSTEMGFAAYYFAAVYSTGVGVQTVLAAETAAALQTALTVLDIEVGMTGRMAEIKRTAAYMAREKH